MIHSYKSRINISQIASRPAGRELWEQNNLRPKLCLNKKRKSSNKIAEKEGCSITTVEGCLITKWFEQDGQYNWQNDCVYAESRKAANNDFGTRPVHKFAFKVMVWTRINFQRITDIAILPQKTSFDAAFYIKNEPPIDGNRLIGTDFTFQQDGAKPHTSGTTIETIESMGFPLKL